MEWTAEPIEEKKWTAEPIEDKKWTAEPFEPDDTLTKEHFERSTLSGHGEFKMPMTAVLDAALAMGKGLIAFPAQIDAFISGGLDSPEMGEFPSPMEVPRWDYDKAQQAHQARSEWLHKALHLDPYTREGKIITDFITGNIDWYSNAVGMYVGNEVDSGSSVLDFEGDFYSPGTKAPDRTKPVIVNEKRGWTAGDVVGAGVAETLKLIAYGGMFKGAGKGLSRVKEIKALRDTTKIMKAKGQYAEIQEMVKGELYNTQAELINNFKAAVEKGDQAEITRIGEMIKNLEFIAPPIPVGKEVTLPNAEGPFSAWPRRYHDAGKYGQVEIIGETEHTYKVKSKSGKQFTVKKEAIKDKVVKTQKDVPDFKAEQDEGIRVAEEAKKYKTAEEKIDSLQEQIDDKLDELIDGGMSFEDANNHPQVERLYKERNAIQDKQLQEAFNDIKSRVQRVAPDIDADAILKEVYSLSTGEATSVYMASEYTVKAVKNRKETGEKVVRHLIRDYGKKNHVDMEGVLNPELSGLTPSGIADLKVELTQKAKKIVDAVEQYFTPPKETPKEVARGDEAAEKAKQSNRMISVMDRAIANMEHKGDTSSPAYKMAVERRKKLESGMSREAVLEEEKKAVVEPEKPNTFKATDPIRESQAELKEIKQTIADQTEIPKTTTKVDRMRILKERNDLYKKQRSLDILDEVPDEQLFTLDQNGMIKDFETRNVLYREGQKPAPVISMSDLKTAAGKKGLEFVPRIGATKLELIVKDATGKEYPFDTMGKAKDWIQDYVEKPQKAEETYYKYRRKEIEDAFDLIDEDVGQEIRIPEITEKVIDESRTIKTDESVPLPKTEMPTEELRYKPEFIERLTQEKILQDYEVLKEKYGLLLGAYIRPLSPLILGVEARTGEIGLWNKFMEIQEGLRNEALWSYKHKKSLNDACKGLNLFARERVYRFLTAPVEELSVNYRQAMKTINENVKLGEKATRPEDMPVNEAIKMWKSVAELSEKEFDASQSVRRILKEAGEEFGIPMERMITHYAPRIRKLGITFDQAIQRRMLPEEFEWFAEEQREGYLMPHEEDIFKVVNAYITRGARKKAVGKAIGEFTETRNRLQKNFKLSKPESIVLDKFIGDVRGWPSDIDGVMAKTVARLTEAVNKAVDKTTFGLAPKRFENVFYEKARIKGEVGKELVRYEETRRAPGFFNIEHAFSTIVDMHLKLSYAGALGAKPMAIIRNMIQPMITVLPIVGGESYAYGLSKALTKSGWNEAKAKGILMDDYMPLPGEIQYAPGSILEQVAYWTLKPYKWSDSMNRCVSYHAMKHNVLKHGERYLNAVENMKHPSELIGLKKKFIQDADMEYFHPALIRNEVTPLLKAGDINGIAERMGRHLSDYTQYVYRKANTPVLMKGNVGKLFGQFGTWPLWYLEHLRSMALRGSKTNRAKRLAIWGGVNLAVANIGGEAFGVDLNRYLFLNPLSWSGGLAVSLVSDIHNAIFGQSEYEKAAAVNGIKQKALLYVPASLQAQSMIKAFDEDRKEDQVKRMLGFAPAK